MPVYGVKLKKVLFVHRRYPMSQASKAALLIFCMFLTLALPAPAAAAGPAGALEGRAPLRLSARIPAAEEEEAPDEPAG